MSKKKTTKTPASADAANKAPKAKAAKPAKAGAEAKAKKLSAIDAARQGAGRDRGGHELPGDDRGDGDQGLLDQPRRQDAARDALRRHSAGDSDQGEGRPLHQDRARQVRRWASERRSCHDHQQQAPSTRPTMGGSLPAASVRTAARTTSTRSSGSTTRRCAARTAAPSTIRTSRTQKRSRLRQPHRPRDPLAGVSSRWSHWRSPRHLQRDTGQRWASGRSRLASGPPPGQPDATWANVGRNGGQPWSQIPHRLAQLPARSEPPPARQRLSRSHRASGPRAASHRASRSRVVALPEGPICRQPKLDERVAVGDRRDGRLTRRARAQRRRGKRRGIAPRAPPGRDASTGWRGRSCRGPLRRGECARPSCP
ncbi:MAG: hypothetical protein KatS3mg082_1945 [Nitrospiraceae bacterium]|nr:MAG: hypothetical protein KatS3mg082_1945 [Nitrospiraceae bacterium]